MTDTITITDLAVLCQIGVPDEERAKPQRLLITAEISRDCKTACTTDDISQTIDYFQVCERIRELCREKPYKLLERLAHEVSTMILREFRADSVVVEVKKFIIPEARYVSFKLKRGSETRNP